MGRVGAVAARGWGGGGSGGGRVAAARARTRVRPERAGAPGPAGTRPGARVAMGEGRRLHAPALRQSPTVAAAAAAPRWLRNAAAPHNHGVRGHGLGLRFPALLGNRDRTSGRPGWRDAAFPSTLRSVSVCRGCVYMYKCVRVCVREKSEEGECGVFF